MAYAEDLLWPSARYGEAEACFRRALEYEPDNWIAMSKYCLMLIQHHRLEEAAALLETVEALGEGGTVKRVRSYFDEAKAIGREERKAAMQERLDIDPGYEGMAQALAELDRD